MKFTLSIIFLIFCVYKGHASYSTEYDESKAQTVVDEICDQLLYRTHRSTVASWNHASNLTSYNERKNVLEQQSYAQFLTDVAEELEVYDYKNFKNESLKRIIKSLTNIGDAKLEETDFKDLQDAVLRMQSNYAKVKIPKYDDPFELVSLEPEITEVFLKSHNPDELKYYWVKWYDSAGSRSRRDFFKYAEIRNKAARLNGFRDGAETWLNAYEDPTFESQIENILNQLRPLYMEFHAFVRHKLAEHYGSQIVNKTKPIPMHLLGNMWAQQWSIESIVLPYKIEKEDIDSVLISKGYTPLRMFQDAERFFTSIGLRPMTKSFWEKSIIEKPNDGREMVCHASAWDFVLGDDVRIKQCTRVSLDSYIVVHHEMGHIQYYLQYRHLPIPFRGGANPGFHEAIGDTIALSVMTQKHQHKLGFIKEINNDKNSQVNQLFKIALDKLPFLPFAYAFDKFRYEVFRGNVHPENANKYFWYLREKHGGVQPPVERTNYDFDIPAKYHGSADVEYLRYFVSFIIQFQFYKAACILADEYEPNNPEKTLSGCDIYGSKPAGEAFKKMLALGASVPWNDALEAMTGERKLDASAMLEYFSPLHEWLKTANKKLNIHVGW